jgi:hypothetical protein
MHSIRERQSLEIHREVGRRLEMGPAGMQRHELEHLNRTSALITGAGEVVVIGDPWCSSLSSEEAR